MHPHTEILRKVVVLAICMLTVTAIIPPPLFAEVSAESEFVQLRGEIREFNERSELSYYQLMLAYENLSRALMELEAAYASQNDDELNTAIENYEKARQEFQLSLSQAYAVREEGEILANRTLSFIARATEAGMFPQDF